MNRIMRDYFPIFQMYQAPRNQLMEILTDDDLGFRPGGDTATLGALCREIGETEHAYIQSFKTFKADFSYRNTDAGLESSVRRLADWYAELDGELKAVVEGLSDEDLDNRVIDRGGDFKLPPRVQLNVYQEALLIFYGKTSIYLKMMGKTLPDQWRDWIG